jgi:[ribosomal protein S5]-alanine N-acetyltransferase
VTNSFFNHSAFFSKFPNLEVDGFSIRDIRISDAGAYYDLFADPNVAKFLSDEDIPNSVEAAEQEIKFWGSLFYRRSSIFWAIADKKSDKLIGTIGFNSWSFTSHRAEICYDLRSDYWRRGIMSAVLSKVLDFAFVKMSLNRIEARTMIHNEASIGILLKKKFKQEGVERGYRKVRGEFIDVTLFSLLASDWLGSETFINNY